MRLERHTLRRDCEVLFEDGADALKDLVPGHGHSPSFVVPSATCVGSRDEMRFVRRRCHPVLIQMIGLLSNRITAGRANNLEVHAPDRRDGHWSIFDRQDSTGHHGSLQ
jgi:hypothetical protein